MDEKLTREDVWECWCCGCNEYTLKEYPSETLECCTHCGALSTE